MITIDGSYGEGGGAIVRTATALSALKTIPIKINNIRAARPNKGLAPQHLTAIKALSKISEASISGLKIGSPEICFYPETISGGSFKIDVKTAGSVTLVIQSLMIPSIFADSAIKFEIIGGTDVRWAPSIDYLSNVTMPILRSFGYDSTIKLIKRGYYPRGGGIVKININPVKKLNPINLTTLEIDTIKGISHCSNLPCHVAQRQAQSAKEILANIGYDVDIKVECDNNSLGPGSGIVLWSEGNSRIAGSDIGAPGKRAELVGKNAANELKYHLSKKAPVDKYMGDQLIPYMAITGDSTIKTCELTDHTLTNIYVAEKITDKEFQVEGKIGETALITVK
ncbi:MAG: RNA 3'-terminal phosphate cyclase [Methanomicrobiales archaeon]